MGKVIKESLRMYGERYGKLPCPTPITLVKTNADFGLPAADCDTTPTTGVTHNSPIVSKTGGVPYKVLGLSESFAADEWDNRYVYTVSNAFISSIDNDDEGVVNVNDRGANIITDEAAFVVYSPGKTGLGGTNHDNLSTETCNVGNLDGENCGGVAGRFIDSSIRETDAAANFYDCLLYTSPSPRDRG